MKSVCTDTASVSEGVFSNLQAEMLITRSNKQSKINCFLIFYPISKVLDTFFKYSEIGNF